MSRAYSFKIFVGFVLINLFVHLPFISYPPCGSHVWRQCNTLALSRNFATESMNIMKPRIDRRNETNGITGSNFPLYEWGLAVLIQVFGDSDALSRLYSLVLFSLGMHAFYLLLIQFGFKRKLALGGAILLLSIPQLYYDSINAMPDIFALTLAIFALYSLIRFYTFNVVIWGLIGILFSLMAGLIKFQFLIIPASSIVFMHLNKKHIILTVSGAIFALTPIVFWYRYALDLTRSNNLKEFGLWIKPISTSEQWKTLFGNIISDLPELLIGWPLFIALTYFTFKRLFNRQTSKFLWLGMIWLGGFILFYLIAIERMQQHSYYFIALLPLFVLAFISIIRNQRHSLTWLIVICILNFTWSFARIIPSRWTEKSMGIPIEFQKPALRKDLQNAVPLNSLCAIGPDISGCIYFYFTKTKGYSFDRSTELLRIENGERFIDKLRKNRVDYLIVGHDQNSDSILDAIDSIRLIHQTGNFKVWKLDHSK